MDHDSFEGFVPPPGYRPRPTARVVEWAIIESTLGPILKLVAARAKELKGS